MAATATQAVLDLDPRPIRICLTRGDTFAWTITLKLNGATIDLTGYTYQIAVSIEENPAAAAYIFVTAGTTLPQGTGVPTNGQVQFQLTLADWAAFSSALTAPADAFCDLQQIDGGGSVRTIAKGPFAVSQDINKN